MCTHEGLCVCTCVHVRGQTNKGRARIFLFSSLAGVLRSGCQRNTYFRKEVSCAFWVPVRSHALALAKVCKRGGLKTFASQWPPHLGLGPLLSGSPVSYACHPPRPSTEACPAPLPTLWQPFPRRSQEPLLQIVWSAAWGQLRRLAHPGPLCIL